MTHKMKLFAAAGAALVTSCVLGVLAVLTAPVAVVAFYATMLGNAILFSLMLVPVAVALADSILHGVE